MRVTKRTGIIGGALALAATIGGVMLLLPTTVSVDGLQAALDAASPGDVLVLEAGATYVGPFTLSKCFAEPITIKSSRADELPLNTRVSPQQSALFAKLQSATNAEPVIKTTAGACGYKFIGVEVSTANAGVAVYDLVRFGAGRQTQNTLASVPRNLSIDRSYIHGWSTQDVQRGVSMNCGECSVTNSYISDIHAVGIEAQAIAAWNGPGPLRIINNYLEAAGENVMIGGADSAIEALMPADVQIRRNYLFKPLSWKVGHPTYAGKHWTVKNLLELKSAKRVVIDGNVLENNWTDAQDGKPVLFTVRNQECSAPWSTVQSVTYANNILKGAEGGLNLLGVDNEAKPAFGKCPAGSPTNGDGTTSVRGTDVLVHNNVFDNISGAFLQINGFYNVTVSRNTHTQRGNLMTLYGEQSLGLKYIDNVTIDHDYCIFGDGGTQGVDALNKYAPGSTVTGNIVAGPKCTYPSGNDHPASIPITSDYRTPYMSKGADIDALLAAQAGSIVTQPSPQLSPIPSIIPSPSPSPTAIPVPSPSPILSPSPSPTATVLPICKPNQFVGNPPTCHCLTGLKGNSGKCR